MKCPRCGQPLEELVLEGRRAVACERCGYADVPADHSPAPRGEEKSWESILREFTDEE